MDVRELFKENPWGTMALSLAILLFLQGARELIGSVYNSNLSTMAINPTIVYILGFFSPVLYPLFLKRLDRKMLLYISGTIAVASRLILSVGPVSALYLPASFLLVSSILLVLRTMLGSWDRPDLLTVSMMSAVCLDIALRTSGLTFDVSIYGFGSDRLTSLLFSVPLALLFLWALYKHVPGNPMRVNNPLGMPLQGTAIGLALFLYMTMSGFPNVMSGWTGVAGMVILLFSIGVLAATMLLFMLFPEAMGSRLVLALSIVALPIMFCLIALGFNRDMVILPSSILFLTIAANAIIINPSQAQGRPRLSLNMLAGLFIFVALAFASVLTLTWAHVPGTGFLKDTMGWIIFMAAVVLSAISALALSPHKEPIAKVATPSSAFALFCMCVLLCSCTVPASQQFVIDTQSQMPDSLSVMTYNIHQGYGMDGILDPNEILDTIQQADPDILVLQESETNRISSMNVDMVNWLAIKLRMDVYSGPSTAEQIYGLALLSKYPIIESELYTLESIEDQRMWFRCLVDIGNFGLPVYGIHVGLSPEDRTSQTNEVIDRLYGETGPFILMGDFNTWPNETIYTNLTGLMHDAWVLAGHDFNGPGTFTFDSVSPSERIDYIFVSQELEQDIISCTIIEDQQGSDHLPVWAELDLSSL